MSINSQIEAYRESRGIKQHEQELLELVTHFTPDFRGRMLDIGCATGAFIGLMNARFPNASYFGLDISTELVEMAKKSHDRSNCSFFVADALAYSPQSRFDIIVASGVLSIYEDFREPLQKWLSWLAKGGRLYVFGRFNSRDIDTVIQFRNNVKGTGWEGGLTSYSIHTVGRFLSQRGCKHEFRPFRLQMDLPESEDPIRTFTITTSEGSRIIVNGANVVAEHYFLVLENT